MGIGMGSGIGNWEREYKNEQVARKLPADKGIKFKYHKQNYQKVGFR